MKVLFFPLLKTGLSLCGTLPGRNKNLLCCYWFSNYILSVFRRCYGGHGRLFRRNHFSDFLEVWKRWDSQHYLNIAENGYAGAIENGEHIFWCFIRYCLGFCAVLAFSSMTCASAEFYFRPYAMESAVFIYIKMQKQSLIRRQH